MNAEQEDEWGDRPLPEDEAIKAAHPTRTGRHELYAEAMRLVGAKRSKGALVELVNWLLYRIDGSTVRLTDEQREALNIGRAKIMASLEHVTGAMLETSGAKCEREPTVCGKKGTGAR